jgi:SAM-dependent methyltransferase
MSKRVDTTQFWADRIRRARKDHYRVYVANDDLWGQINRVHERILKSNIAGNDKVLDAGCGYGRLAPLFKKNQYTGVDFSPEMIEIAKRDNPEYEFMVESLYKLPFEDGAFNVAFCVSIKDMIVGNIGEEAWEKMQAEVKRVANKVLILEYTHPSKFYIL